RPDGRRLDDRARVARGAAAVLREVVPAGLDDARGGGRARSRRRRRAGRGSLWLDGAAARRSASAPHGPAARRLAAEGWLAARERRRPAARGGLARLAGAGGGGFVGVSPAGAAAGFRDLAPERALPLRDRRLQRQLRLLLPRQRHPVQPLA